MVGGANSHFTFSLQNLDSHIGNFQTYGLVGFNGAGAGTNTVNNLDAMQGSEINFTI